jgi:hypothetical protein
VVLGLAETAIALAQGVHAAWTGLCGRDDVVFLHTTRYRLARPLAFAFEEEHSHASRHFVYEPEEPAARALFRAARTLVIVDDEATTGNTFLNLARAFAHPGLERVCCVMLSDWSGEAPFLERMPAETSMISLLQGSYRFTPSGAPPSPAPPAVGDDLDKDALLPLNRGRLGLRHALAWEGALPPVREGDRVLVLGTGEFAWLPFRLAERLEASGADVRFQATTRSPVLVGNDVATCLTFPDNYAEGIPNYLYNVAPGQYERVLVCHETPRELVPDALVDALGAVTLRM